MDPDVDKLLETWAVEAAKRALTDPLPSLRVLVWGPSLVGVPRDAAHRRLQDKRKEIVAELQKMGHAATTSEDLVARVSEKPESREIISQPLHHIEKTQLEEADFVIVLLGPPGTIAETSGILSSRRLARRSAVFYDEGVMQGTYVEAGPLQNLAALGATHPYDAEDLVQCRVASAAIAYAEDQASSLRGTSE